MERLKYIIVMSLGLAAVLTVIAVLVAIEWGFKVLIVKWVW